MKDLIKKILRETAESQNFQELCNSSEEVNEMMKTFTVWRSALCNQTSIETPEELVKKEFGNKETIIKNDKDGIKHTFKKTDYLPKWEKNYKNTVARCGGTLYNATTGRLNTEESCANSIILSEYENTEIRESFNTRFGFPKGCHVNDIRTCREPVNNTPINYKEGPSKIERPNVEPKLKPQTPTTLPQTDTTLLQKIRKSFKDLMNSIN